MAHLLHNPFQKHFEFPRTGPLLTPPETEPEYHAQHQQVPSNGLGIELEPAPSHRTASATEVPISRRLQYIHSGPREARERVVHRGVRWLVVVTPPPSLSQEHGLLGHTLTGGPQSRLGQGLLMPLLQTMSSQLAAIAREFAFPSTAGLCLYLHTSHGGLSITPRITDESWPLLWAHLFEPRSPTPSATPQLPIGGRIEFDIDTSKARWLDAWLGLVRRDNVDVPVSVTPSRRESLSHFRLDSKTTFHDDRTDEPLDGASLTIPPAQSRAPGSRHVPRKLSLLDRLESASVRSSSKIAARTRNSPSPPAYLDAPPRPSLGLSPIVQEDEPKTAKKDIDVFVNTWRASASVAPTPLAATGQTSLDPVNLPNDMEIAVDEDARSELDLNDFQWSVSSVGPPEHDYDWGFDSCSVESWRIPSVHMDRRGEGSVCLTPTTCTSFGPADWNEEDTYGPHFVTLAMAAMQPSPDIATRMIEDCPPTPSTATSWGPPLEWPPSPARSELSYAGSVDLGQRCTSAVPMTPSTATSWGPPLSWPPSPASPYRVHTPDIGQRTFDLDIPLLNPAPRAREQAIDGTENEPWKNVWPYIGTSAADTPGTFVFPQRPASPPSEPSQPQAPVESSGPFAFGWPFFDVSTEAPAVITEPPPERSVEPIDQEDARPVVRVKKLSPFTVLLAPQPEAAPVVPAPQPAQQGPWNHVWPYALSTAEARDAHALDGPWNHVWPYAASSGEISTADTPRMASGEAHETSSGPWNHVWPFNAAPVQASVTYPYFNLYPAVYPNFDLYPAETGALDHRAPTKLTVQLEPSYPVVRPYRPVYPYLEIYPGAPMQNLYSKVVVSLSSDDRSYYPAIDIYGPQYPSDVLMYPWNVYNIYPAVSNIKQGEKRDKDFKVLTLTAGYPTLDIYAPVYPHNLERIYPPVTTEAIHKSTSRVLPTRLEAVYPYLEIYAPVYPHNTQTIYPPVLECQVRNSSIQASSKPIHSKRSLTVRLPTVYPSLILYSPVYPYNVSQIYPTVAIPKANPSDNCREPIIVRLRAHYPTFDLYPAGYPYNVSQIYPTVTVAQSNTSSKRKEPIVVPLPVHYPTFDLYPAGYPYNVSQIYPVVAVARSNTSSKCKEPIVIRLPAYYPTFDLYPAGYPWHLSSIYPSVVAEAAPAIVVLRHRNRYPYVQPYEPVYPYNLDNIYPPVLVNQEEKRPVRSTAKSKSPAHKFHHLSHHAKRSLSASKIPIPPVPPLPQNIQSLRPINPTSHQPLSSRVGMSLPVQLSLSYPHICPYPPVYPFLEMYPPKPSEHSARPGIKSSLAPSRKPSPTHLDLHGQVAAFAAHDGYAPRRRAKYTHMQLHQKVFGLSSPTSPRKLPTPPSSPPAALVSLPSAPRARTRSGTVSQRPALPSPPILGRAEPTGDSSTIPSSSTSPMRAPRRLPPIPPHGSPRGLPSDPAVLRRTSMMPTVHKVPSFSALQAVPEPTEMSSDSFSSAGSSPQSPPRRPLPLKPSVALPEASDFSRSTRPMSTLAPPVSVVAPGLSRANTLPSRPVPRARRDSVAAPSGKVAELTKAFSTNGERSLPSPEKNGVLSSTLAQFPVPPRPPLPPLPNSRPVSKLDRSKYLYH